MFILSISSSSILESPDSIQSKQHLSELSRADLYKLYTNEIKNPKNNLKAKQKADDAAKNGVCKGVGNKGCPQKISVKLGNRLCDEWYTLEKAINAKKKNHITEHQLLIGPYPIIVRE